MDDSNLPPYDFQTSVGYWICQASRAFERAMNDELAPRGITYRQAQVLWHLAHEANLSQSDLAERMRIEPPTLVGILDRMEREGWIRREGDANDRRRKLVMALGKAKPVWSQIVACADRVRRRATAGLQPDELQIIRELVKRVLNNLQNEHQLCTDDAEASAGAASS
jgi:MarR family transcriptional regulator for hemolysin